MMTTLNGSRVWLTMGGPIHKISVKGKLHTFEFHPWIGPALLKKDGEPYLYQPIWFLEAATRWAQQGKRVGEDGLCVWDEPKKGE